MPTANSADDKIAEALEAVGLKHKKGVTDDGEPTFELPFAAPDADTTRTSWVLTVLPQLVLAFDVRCLSSFPDAAWRSVPPTELAKLCVEADSRHMMGELGHLEFTRKANTVTGVVRNEPIRDGETAAALGARIQAIAAAYGRVHTAIASVVVNHEDATAAVSKLGSAISTEGERMALINKTMEAALRGAGMRSMDIGEKQISLDMGLENGRCRVVWQYGMASAGANARGLLRFIMKADDRAGPTRREELAVFVALANYGIQLGHFDVDLSDGDLAFNVNVRLPAAMEEDEMRKEFDMAFVIGAQTFDRYLPGAKAIATGMDALAAIRMVEGEAPELPAIVRSAPGNGNNNNSNGGDVEEVFSSATVNDRQYGLFNVGSSGGDPRTRLRAAIIAAMGELGIARYEERGSNRFVFGLTYASGDNVGNDIQFSAGDGPAGLRVLHRVFDTKGATEENFGVLAEYVARANFGMNVGHFDLDTSDNTVSFNINLRFDTRVSDERMKIDLASGFKCAFDTFKKYYPGLRTILYPTVPHPSALVAIRIVEDDGFDIDAALDAAQNTQPTSL